MRFTRYGVKVKRTIPGEATTINWVSIGSGYTANPVLAHLYGSLKLATKKVEHETKAHKKWAEATSSVLEYQVIEFTVEENSIINKSNKELALINCKGDLQNEV